MRAGIYARRSPRPTETETVARQLGDSRDLCASLGWEVAGEYVDKDISAYSMKRRPDYRRLLEDIEAGRLDAVVASHTTRLYRHPKDLVEFISLVQKTKIEVRTVTSGHYDLNTAAGRKHAYQAGLDGMYEAELLGERVARERKARAAAGKPGAGGKRPFGYQADKVSLHPVEAPLIASAAKSVAAGGSLYAVACAWNEAGVLTTAGNLWEVSAVGRVLASPRIAGLREHKGTIVGPALWTPIIDRDTRELVLASVQSRSRVSPRRTEWLLSALIACPRCGRVMYGSLKNRTRSYVCAPGPGRGCGRASVSAQPCDEKVLAFVDDALEADLSRLGTTVTRNEPADAEEMRSIEERRASIATRYGAGQMSDIQYDNANEALAKRQAKLDARPPAQVRIAGDALLAAWRRGETEDRRVVIAALVDTPMPLSPERREDPADRLTVRLRA